MKILFVGDMHFRENLHHCEDFEDRRLPERKAIEDFIVHSAEECDMVVLSGDIFDTRNPPANTVRQVTEFLERFGDKRMILIAGNHENTADGKSALDYIKELTGKNWRVVNNEVAHEEGIVFVPYFRQKQFAASSDAEVVGAVLQGIDALLPVGAGFSGLVIHHCIGGTKTTFGQMTDTFHEPVFPAQELLRISKRVFGAHIHLPQDNGNLHVLGSIMNHDIGEDSPKRIIRWDQETDTIESLTLPGRRFAKLVDPTPEDLRKAKQRFDLVKIVTSEPIDPKDLEGLAETVKVTEKPKESRKKSKEEVLDFSPGNLLRVYAKERDIPEDRLLSAWKAVGGA